MSGNTQRTPTSSAPPPVASGTEKVKLKPLDAPTERPKSDPPEYLPPDQRVGYAIVGLGHLSLEELLPAFGQCKKSKLVALVSGDPQKAATIAKQYGLAEKNIYNYENYDKLSENPDVQVIYIVLPNSMHAEYTIRGAKAGKHILCEKPMANSSKECQDMINACKQANRKLMIAYRIQYEPYNKEVKKMVRSKQLGTVKIIEATNAQHIGDPEQWRLKKNLAGGGALPDIGLYCLNTIRYLTGEEPMEVSATQYSTPGDVRFREVEETMLFQMRFPSGILASCTTSYGHHEGRRYRVFAEKGWVGLDPAFSYTGLQMQRSQAEGKIERKETPVVEAKNQFALEIDHMSECVLEDRMPYTPGEEGLQDQRIMEAMYESARTHKPVKLTPATRPDAFRGPEPQQS